MTPEKIEAPTVDEIVEEWECGLGDAMDIGGSRPVTVKDQTRYGEGDYAMYSFGGD